MKRKSAPQRTCVACRHVKSKRELIRVVRTPDGTVCVDETGKDPGRGAYLCRDSVCWEKGIGKGNVLGHSLKVTLSETDRAALLAYALQLPTISAKDLSQKES